MDCLSTTSLLITSFESVETRVGLTDAGEAAGRGELVAWIACAQIAAYRVDADLTGRVVRQVVALVDVCNVTSIDRKK